jgi:four helix bundle protein
MATYKELKVWQQAVELVTHIYKATKNFPKEEIYCLAVQMRRAAISIPSNIAEGAGRSSRKEYAQFLVIANGSCCELETQIIIANNLGYLTEKQAVEFQTHISSIGRMISALQKYLKT